MSQNVLPCSKCLGKFDERQYHQQVFGGFFWFFCFLFCLFFLDHPFNFPEKSTEVPQVKTWPKSQSKFQDPRWTETLPPDQWWVFLVKRAALSWVSAESLAVFQDALHILALNLKTIRARKVWIMSLLYKFKGFSNLANFS